MKIILAFIEELQEFLNNKLDKIDWNMFCSNFHKIKGALQVLNLILENNSLLKKLRI